MIISGVFDESEQKRRWQRISQSRKTSASASMGQCAPEASGNSSFQHVKRVWTSSPSSKCCWWTEILNRTTSMKVLPVIQTVERVFRIHQLTTWNPPQTHTLLSIAEIQITRKPNEIKDQRARVHKQAAQDWKRKEKLKFFRRFTPKRNLKWFPWGRGGGGTENNQVASRGKSTRFQTGCSPPPGKPSWSPSSQTHRPRQGVTARTPRHRRPQAQNLSDARV